MFGWVNVKNITRVEQVKESNPSVGQPVILFRAMWGGSQGEEEIPYNNL